MITLIESANGFESLKFRRSGSNENHAPSGHFPRYDPALSFHDSRAGSI
jgi:hypothetical protein